MFIAIISLWFTLINKQIPSYRPHVQQKITYDTKMWCEKTSGTPYFDVIYDL